MPPKRRTKRTRTVSEEELLGRENYSSQADKAVQTDDEDVEEKLAALKDDTLEYIRAYNPTYRKLKRVVEGLDDLDADTVLALLSQHDNDYSDDEVKADSPRELIGLKRKRVKSEEVETSTPGWGAKELTDSESTDSGSTLTGSTVSASTASATTSSSSTGSDLTEQAAKQDEEESEPSSESRISLNTEQWNYRKHLEKWPILQHTAQILNFMIQMRKLGADPFDPQAVKVAQFLNPPDYHHVTAEEYIEVKENAETMLRTLLDMPVGELIALHDTTSQLKDELAKQGIHIKGYDWFWNKTTRVY